MGHSAEGPGATHFSSSTRDSVPPVSDAKHDVKQALYAWVERGEAPDALIATRYVDDGKSHAPGKAPIAWQRPVCVYPERPVYRGGPTAAATSFACETPAPE
jgi:feruloyl esterase